MEGGRKYEGSRCRKVGSKLGGPVPSHYSGRRWGLLLGRHGENTTAKCKYYDEMSYTLHVFRGNGIDVIVFFNFKLYLLYYKLLL